MRRAPQSLATKPGSEYAFHSLTRVHQRLTTQQGVYSIKTVQQSAPDSDCSHTVCGPTFQPITSYTPILDSEFTDQPKQNDKPYNLERLNMTGMVSYLVVAHPPCGYCHNTFFVLYYLLIE